MIKHSNRWFVVCVALATSIASAAAPTDKQKHFTTPDDAVEALIGASRANNAHQLRVILGAEGVKLIRSGDSVEDRSGRSRFVAAYDAAHVIELEGEDKAVLNVGEEHWPLPIPLRKESSGWRFDTQAGVEEILNRRVGRNELRVMEVCQTYVKAQQEYAALQIGGRSEFARQFKSTPGHQDGLYWPAQQGEPESPLGPLVAQARAAGYVAHRGGTSDTTSRPFHGYYFRILTAQGSHAPGGAASYLAGERLAHGFALIAYPATYGNSGVMTFVVNQLGIVFEKDLGPDTARLAGQIEAYDPDASWRAP
ncbi:MAG: DUF2950 domain-containing protein [Steroidobacteraceae bacterium]|jgi:hypothetical protein